MAIDEVWLPVNTYSSRSGAEVLKFAFHATEGILDLYDLQPFFNSNGQASSHWGVDNIHDEVGAYVDETWKAWTQCEMNPWCISVEQCAPNGASYGYSREYWLSEYDHMLHVSARLLRYACDKWSIPLRLLNNTQAQDTWTKGVVQHMNFGQPGCGHGDCGTGYPIDKVLEWAQTGGGIATDESGGLMSSAVLWPRRDGRKYMVCVGEDRRLYYRGPDTGGSWHMVDPKQAEGAVKSGGSLDVDDAGRLLTCYTRSDGNVCTYLRGSGGGSWGWEDHGGNAI
jgi:hypothetical protein